MRFGGNLTAFTLVKTFKYQLRMDEVNAIIWWSIMWETGVQSSYNHVKMTITVISSDVHPASEQVTANYQWTQLLVQSA